MSTVSQRTAKPPASYWSSGASTPATWPKLSGDVSVPVAIVGAGFTGLSAAYHLHKRGIEAIVLDANAPGWGASGRNGGIMPPRYKKGFAAIAARYGHDVTRRLHTIIHEAIDTVEAIVDECSIECGFARTGQLTAAHSTSSLNALRADAEWMKREARDSSARILDRNQVFEEIGGGKHVGGWLDPRGAGMNPLAYAQGLATSLATRGTRIYAGNPVEQLVEEGNCVRLMLPGGAVKAQQLVIATNAYTDTFAFAPGGLHRRIVPVTSSVITTAPLSEKIAASILPTGRMVADTKQIMNWYRIMPDRRLVFGGRGDITGHSDTPSAYALLEGELYATFPQLADSTVQYRWSGKVAVTLDDFPHLGRLSPRISYGLGYGGRGVALSNIFGKYLAALVCGESIDAGPMTNGRFGRVPFHALRIPGMQIVARWYRYQDERAIRMERHKEARAGARRPHSA